MQYKSVLAAAFCLGALIPSTALSAVLYNNLTPNNSMGAATNPGPGLEIETADDFILNTESLVNSGSFTGLLVPGTGGTPTIAQVIVEIYRVFPKDSDTVRTPNVPTRVNSPSDVAFDSRDSSVVGQLLFSTTLIAPSFTILNSVQPGGIHPKPNQQTNGNGPLTGQEVQFDVTFATPFDLPGDHYFFVPQVLLTNGAHFYWLSASRPIIGGGTTTPINPDLQAWTRDSNLDPDWLRIGTDIVGGTGNVTPTFNMAFSLDGTALPEPASTGLVFAGLGLLAAWRYRARKS